MNQALQKYVEAATGITTLTKAQAERIVKQMVRQGEAARDQAGDLVEDLMTRSRENREQLTKVVKNETQRVIKAMGLASQTEVERLEKQVRDLKNEVADAKKSSGTTTSGGAKKTAKKSPAKKSPAKKSAKKSAAKKSAKKTAAKKTAKKASKGTKKSTKKGTKKSTKKSS